MSAEMLERLQRLNPSLDIKPVTDKTFAPYGHLIEDEAIPALIRYIAENIPVPEGTSYLASDEKAEAFPVFGSLRRGVFGEQDIQIGWCCGTNIFLNALEYHAGVEINIAATDAVLLLAKLDQMENDSIDGAAVRGFYLAAGESVVLDSSTLHFAPCAVDENGFRVAIVLTRGTNTPLDAASTDKHLFMKNKWLLAHRDAAHLIKKGAQVGLTGTRKELKWKP